MPDPGTLPAFDPAQYWEQRLSDRYSLESVGWSSLGEAFNRWSYAVRANAFRRIVREVTHGTDPGRVLDVGSGTGFYLEQWRRLAARAVTGSDLTSTAVDRLRVRFPLCEIHQVDIGDARLPPVGAPYDAISAMDVLFHLVDDARYERALHNLAGLLKPDGVLIFTENFMSARQEGKHQISRTGEQIQHALVSAGLTPVAEHPVFFLMNTPVSSDGRALKLWWDSLCRLVRRHEAIGWVLGATLYPVEVGLSRMTPRGPSTQIVAARRS
jgi:SAM-dependent methyltransferase